MHYNDEDIIDLDYNKDQKLPFKSQGGYTGAVLSVFEPTPFYSLIPKVEIALSVAHPISNESFISSTFRSSIWQPPKSC